MGNRSYAPGIMSGLNGPRTASDGPIEIIPGAHPSQRTDLPPSAVQVGPPAGLGAPPATGGQPSGPPVGMAAGGMSGGIMDQVNVMAIASARAQSLIDSLIQRANASQQMRGRGRGGY